MTSSPPKIIWTLPAIGRRVGRGREYAESLARKPGSPIRRDGRQYYVFEDDLIRYMREEDERRSRP